ncbi:protein dispatched homolog 1-like [Strongylocentrotus purpuratus]|uniref:SSD domain-containing protein n=1 Tax=Strongylocentrotus purpuratus TaxID=7668 RepID=A0A7M7P9F6_STRPU|nr:protein dispatched homolog 1-like [Strongylocentrotus purpuratus]
MPNQASSIVVTSIPPPSPPSVISQWRDGLSDEDESGLPKRNNTFFGILAKCFWSFPVTVCVIEFVLLILMGATVVSLYGSPAFDDASKGVEARGTPIHDRLIAFENLLREEELFSVLPNGVDIASVDELDDQSSTQSVEDITQPEGTINFCGTPDFSGFRMVCESSSPSNPNLLTREHLISMCRHDDVIVRNTSHFQTACKKDASGSCCATWSLANYIVTMNNRVSCFGITGDDVDRMMALLQHCAPFYSSGDLQPGCSEEQNCSSRVPVECIGYDDAVYFIFYALTPGSFSSSLNTGDAELTLNLHLYPLSDDADALKMIYLENIYHQSLDDGVTMVIGIGVDTRKVKLSTYSNALRGDFLYVGIGCAVIVAIIWIYMESLLTAILVLLQMALSLMLGYFFHFVVFRFAFFPFMSLLAVILVIAVGADDAFIFMDIWRKNLKLSTDQSRVNDLRTTLKEATLTMFVTSFTNAAALFVTAFSDVTTVRLFSIYSGMVILANFCLTIIWLPPAVMISEKYIHRRKVTSEPSSAKHKVFFAKTKRKLGDIIHSFFRVHLPKFVLRFRFVWLILFPILFIGSLVVVFFKPGLSLPSGGDIMLYKPAHPIERYDQVLKWKFDFENASVSQLPIIVVWGIIPLDNGDHWDPDDRGHVLLEAPLNLSSQDSQQWLLNFCQEMRRQGFYQRPTMITEDCFIESFGQFMQQPCVQPAIEGDQIDRCCNQDTFPLPSVLFDECLPLFIADRCKRYPCNSPIPGPRFGPNNSISALYVQFESSVLERFEFQETNEFWNNASSWVNDQMQSAPEGLRKGWFVTFSDKQPYFLDNTLGFARGARTSLALSIAIAAGVVLLTSRNIIMVLLIILSIGGAVITALAALVFAGWELNVFESSMMALIVGLTVDFTLHYGVAYLHGPDTDRRSRSHYSISTISRANSMAALSSFVAGSLMLPADVIIFTQLGIALQIIMVCSWATGTFFFISLCRTIGPEKNHGKLSSFCKKSDGKPITPVI